MPALSSKLPPLFRNVASLLDRLYRGQLPHVHLSHLDDDGVVHDADGSTRHAGFGLGFERCVMYLTGMGNIRDVIPFPRTVNNCEL